MAVRSLRFVLTGDDKTASKSLDKVGRHADGLGKKLGGLAKLGGAAVGAGAVAFGASSIKAFMEAEKAQNELAFAYKKFPKLADASLDSIKGLNSALATKTTFDDDAIASGQSVLAQFGLTGKELKKVTPLLLDYAAKTGQDLPSAAKALGMAFNGNAKALKQIGITIPKASAATAVLTSAQRDAARSEDKLTAARRKLKDVQDLLHGKAKLTVADQIKLRNAQYAVKDASDKNKDALVRLSDAQKKAGTTGDMFSQVMSGLSKKVGGFAQSDAKSAEGQVKILKNRFGELQETVGEQLLPVVSSLVKWMNDKGVPALQGFADQFSKGEGAGGAMRDALIGLKDAAQTAADVANKTIVPVVKWFADHPDALKGVAGGMAAYATATRAAAIWSAALAKTSTTPGVPGAPGGAGGGAGKGGKLLPLMGGPVGVGIAVGVGAGIADKHLGPLGSGGKAGTSLGNPKDFYKGADGKYYPKPKPAYPSPKTPGPAAPPMISPTHGDRPLVIHLQSVLDGKVVAQSVTRHQRAGVRSGAKPTFGL